MKRFKISLRNGESVSYDISALVVFLTFSVVIASIKTPLNSLYAKAVAIVLNAKAIGEYVIYNGVAFQITNLCLGLIEMGAVLILFFFDRKLQRAVIPLILVFLFNFLRILISIIFGYEFLFRVLFEFSIVLIWLIFRNDFRLKLVNFRILPTSRR